MLVIDHTTMSRVRAATDAASITAGEPAGAKLHAGDRSPDDGALRAASAQRLCRGKARGGGGCRRSIRHTGYVAQKAAIGARGRARR